MKSSLRFNRGVTLIELMVVVAIVAILTMIAIPSYQAFIMRSHRAAARACMSEASQYMERFYTTRLTYVGADPAGDGVLGLSCELESGLNARYTIRVDTLAQRTFRVVGTPIGVQLAKDTQCGTLSLNQRNERTPTTTGCW